MRHAVIRLIARVRAFLSPGDLDRDFDQELESHLSMVEEEYVRRGMTAGEARRAARLGLGGLPQLREAHRDARGLPLVDEFLADVRYGLRGIKGNPGFGAVAILTLAIGIGANSAMFSVVYGVLLQPLGYPDPGRLVFVARSSDGNGQQWLSLPRVEATRKSVRSLTDLGAYLARRNEDVTFSGRGEPEVLRGARVSANFLEILGVRPERGRSFLPAEDVPGGPPVAMISAALWKRRFADAVSIDGQMATLDSVPHTIIGVLPEGFRFPFPDVDVWLTQPSQTPSLAPQFRACCVGLFGFGRMKPGVSLEQARAELEVVSAQHEAARPKAIDRGPLRLAPLKDELTTRVSSMLWMLLAAVGFVLLIACANVATLLMARATSRERELAVRSALGAPRGRLVRQLLTESLVLSVAGGALGLLVAAMTVGLFTRSGIFDLPRADEVHLSGIVLAFTTAVAVLAGLVFGMLPALQIMRPGLVESLRQSGATGAAGRAKSGWLRMNTRAALVALQVALSVVLLVGAALMLKSLAQLAAVDTGFQSHGLLTMRIPLPATRYDSPEKKAAVFEDIGREVHAVPAVRALAMARALPTTNTLGTNIQIVGQEIPDPGHVGMVLQSVTPGFFQVLGVPVRRGREFTPRDNTSTSPRVVIVNESFARRFWPSYPNGLEPLGKRIVVPILDLEPFDVVGVVADVRHGGLKRDAPAQFYLPNAMYPPQSMYLAVRTNGDPLSSVAAIRAAVLKVDPNQSIADVRMMDQILERSVGQQHLATRLLGVFAGAALLLALVGLYGVLAYSVAQRTQEIGIRRSLGAGRPAVLGMVLRQAVRLTLIGVLCGLAGAFALTRVLETLLFQVSATDPGTFIAVAMLFVVVALVAGLVPAWRAARIDPITALRPS